MTQHMITGTLAPILTPFKDDLSIDIDLFISHAQSCLAQGCSGLVPFGSTGEALSLSFNERKTVLKAMIEAGIDPALLIPGSGFCDFPDTVAFTKYCMDLGCNSTLMLPPFFFKSVTNEGLYEYFSHVIENVGDKARIFLYHIPQVSGVAIPIQVARDIKANYPEHILGAKDSSGVWENTNELLGIENFKVYPGSELPLKEALELGAPGSITASANLYASGVKRYIELHQSEGMAAAITKEAYLAMKCYRQAIDSDFIGIQKGLLAHYTKNKTWLNMRPPLKVATPEKVSQVRELIEREIGFTYTP